MIDYAFILNKAKRMNEGSLKAICKIVYLRVGPISSRFQYKIHEYVGK